MWLPICMDVYSAIADPVRRDLLRTLAGSSARVADLAQGRSISRPAVSKHLRLLTEAGLVGVQQIGRERHYSLRPQALDAVAAFVAEVTSATVPPVTASMLDALDLEVRRVVRDRPATEPDHDVHPRPMESA